MWGRRRKEEDDVKGQGQSQGADEKKGLHGEKAKEDTEIKAKTNGSEVKPCESSEFQVSVKSVTKFPQGLATHTS